MLPFAFSLGRIWMIYADDIQPHFKPHTTEAKRQNHPALVFFNWAYWGYLLILLGMGAIALSLVLFFWRRGWFRDFSHIRGQDVPTNL